MLKRIARPPTLWDVNVKQAHSPIGTGSIVQAQACGHCAENCIFPTGSSTTFHANVSSHSAGPCCISSKFVPSLL